MEKEQNQEEKEKQKHRCIKCSSTFCYLRVKTNEWQCRSCGFVEKVKEGENING